MPESLTFKLVDEILEAAGLRGVEETKEMLDEIGAMPTGEFNSLADDIWERIKDYYRKNLKTIQDKLVDMEGLKVYYYGRYSPLATAEGSLSDRFLRKASLYYDKIIVENHLEISLFTRESSTEESIRRDFIESFLHFTILRPWMEHGLVELLPEPMFVKGIGDLILKFASEDYDTESKDPESPYLKNEDLNLEDGALVEIISRLIAKSTPKDSIEKEGGLGEYVLGALIDGASKDIGGAVFGSVLFDSNPLTESRSSWRLLGYWAGRRAEGLVKSGYIPKERQEEMMRQARAGKAWLSAEIRDLKFITDLPVEKVLEIRDSSDYSLSVLRKDLGKAVKNIEKSEEGDRGELKKIVEQELEKVRADARKVKDDLDKIKTNLPIPLTASSVMMRLGIVSFHPAALVFTEAPDETSRIAFWTKKKFCYFLLR